MTPAAPTATWRRVCEDYFSRLIEDLEQQVESEVESRVTATVEAAVRGAGADATGETRRALAEELNQAVRRLRQSDNGEDLYATLLDVTLSFCEQAAVFHPSKRRPCRVHATYHGRSIRRRARGVEFAGARILHCGGGSILDCIRNARSSHRHERAGRSFRCVGKPLRAQSR